MNQREHNLQEKNEKVAGLQENKLDNRENNGRVFHIETKI